MARKIQRRIPAHVSVSYQCEKCERKYRTPTKAQECESQPVEPKKFKVGDRVSWREAKECGQAGRNYFINAIVTKVIGPTLPDEEYNIKWLQGHLAGKHVYEYLLNWNCPYCTTEHAGVYYGIELLKVNDNLPFTNCRKMEQFMRRNGMYKSPE